MTSTEGSDINSTMNHGSGNSSSTILDYGLFDTASTVCGLGQHLEYDRLYDRHYVKYLQYCLRNPNNDDEAEGERDEGEDPELRMLMKNIRAVANPFAVKAKGGSEIMYEGSVVPDDGTRGFDEINKADDVEDEGGRSKCDGENLRSGRRRNRRNSSGRRFKSDCKRIHRETKNVVRNEKAGGRVKNIKRRNNVEREESFIETERDCLIGKGDLKSDHLSNVSRKRKRRRNEDNSRISEPQLKHNKEDAIPDPTYMKYLDCCVAKGESFAVSADGKTVIYEDDNQSSYDSEVLVFDKAPDCIELNYTPVSNSNVRDAQMQEDDCIGLGGCSKTENPLFRKEVMDILRKPFSKKEYKRLRHVVKLRKPIERHIDLRQGIKTISQAAIGKSYLDHFPDVERQLVAFKNDIPKRLNVLRGFVFYLKKIPEDGIFKPWLDKSCLAIFPRTC